MVFVTFEEAVRARDLAADLCGPVTGHLTGIGERDRELVALGLFLIVLMSEHAEDVAEVVAKRS